MEEEIKAKIKELERRIKELERKQLPSIVGKSLDGRPLMEVKDERDS